MLHADTQTATGSNWTDLQDTIHGACGRRAEGGKSLVNNAGEYGYGFVYEADGRVLLPYDMRRDVVVLENGMIALPKPSTFQPRAWTLHNTADLP